MTLLLIGCAHAVPQESTKQDALATVDMATKESAVRLPELVATESDATALVNSYTVREAMGEQFKSPSWFDSVSTSRRPPRFDSLQVIRSFGVGAMAISGDTARILVTYRVMGALAQARGKPTKAEIRFTSFSGNEFGEFVLARTSAGWRVVGTPHTMFVFASSFLSDPAMPTLPTAIRDQLQRELAEAR
ncbi:MAG: hypothetical protein ABIY52_04850 [Gemmatimonadaceae bacterium]